ncbi:BTB/POZ domain-containing protein 1-like [Centruroides vittatus]|uniref:BTB/POZ domain-containing protein 1-like n=1 Tax=Centruroides vittatus TaxID=120091 RepID=UPI0035105EB5
MYKYNPFITTYVISEDDDVPFSRLQVFPEDNEISIRLWNHKAKNEILDMCIYIKRDRDEKTSDKWQKLESDNAKMLYLFESEDFADAIFLIGKDFQKYFKVHKIYLGAASNVFEEYFLKNNYQEDKVIKIPDIDPDTFESLLYFIYISKLKTTSVEKSILLQSAAEKFQLNDLVSSCRQYILDHLTPNNACQALAHAIKENDKELRMKCKRLIAADTKDVVLSEGFLNSTLEIVTFILGMKNLCYESEVFLYSQLCRWSWTQCCKRKGSEEVTVDEVRNTMEPLLPFISFLSMSKEEFLHYAFPFKILTHAEANAIIENIVNPGSKELPHWCWEGQRKPGFKLRPWQYNWRTTWVCEISCYNKKKLKSQLGYSGCKFDLKYKDIDLRGLCFFAQTESDINLPGSCEIAVWFSRSLQSRFIKLGGKLSHDSATDIFKVIFLKPLFLEAGETYTFLVDSRPLFKNGDWTSCANLVNIIPSEVEGVEFIFRHIPIKYRPFLIIDHPHELLFKIR